jgi:DNA-binding NarL/FixJ family response regulator
MNERVLIFNKNLYESAILNAALQLHGISILGQVKNNEMARRLISTFDPDAVIADLDSDPLGCLDVVTSCRKLTSKIGILLTTTSPDLRLLGIKNSQLPGGSKILLKRNLGDLNLICTSIADAIEEADGNFPCSWIVTSAAREDQIMRKKIRSLTNIQIETLRMISDGLSNKEIAKRRFVSEKAVEQIVSRIAEQLGYTHDFQQNLRVLLVAEYFRWLGVAS